MSSLPSANSPVADTISWPLQPSLPPPPVDDITTPPPLLPIIPASFPSPPSSLPVSPLVGNASPPPLLEIAPFVSPPFPPTTSIGVVLPPVNSVPPSIATPTLTSPAPIIIPIIISPPPLKTTPSPPIIPVKPPLPSVTSPPFPTSPLSPPPPPSPLPPQLVTSLPPLSTPSPLSLSPLPPPAGITPSTILSLPPPTPIRPNYPRTPTSAFPLTPRTAPTSTYTKSQPLPLPLANGSRPVTSTQSHISIGLIFGCIIGGVFLLLVFGLIFICNKNSKSGRNNKNPSLESKDNSKIVVNQDSAQNGWPRAHVIRVQTETFSLPPPSTSNRDSVSMTSGLENPLPIQAPCVALSFLSGTFTYDELVSATNGFSEANLIGEGGFGYVHKGFLRTGQQVAVKQLKEGSGQGEREFRAEIEIINQVHHKHLVSLIGYCIAGTKRLLVYEFVPNNTLEFHLHGNGQPVMDWDVRLKIAIGSAKGLAYLHEDCNPIIIHRDIKAANILLDHKFEAKVSDFGLAKSFSDARTSITHISTRVVGTFGYLAPEYASSGKVTEKSDVYSYGVMLLELITGRPPISDINFVMKEALVTWARPLLTEALEHGNVGPLVDRRLENNYNISEMTRMIACAVACIRHSSWLRPRMGQIVRALEGDILVIDLIQGTEPGRSTLYASTRSSNYDAFQYKQDGEKHNMALASGYSGSTSEYGLNPSSSSSDFSCR